MKKKNERNTKGKIISAAWKLFYEQGYDDTTIEDIIYESGTSKGSFYHYFDGKDALLSSLSYLFDEQYEHLAENMPEDMGAMERLIYINAKVFLFIENTVPIELLSRLLSSQLITKGEKHLLDYNRTYYKLLRRIITRGQETGEIRDDIPVNELVKDYALCERAMMYDYCICEGNYSLCAYSKNNLPNFISFFRK